MQPKKKRATFYAILAATLYAISIPLSKLLLVQLSPTVMASMLYLGAGIGMAVIGFVQRRIGKGSFERLLTRKDLPYTIGMVVLDIAAPVFLMLGLKSTTAANASLLNNFEIVATAVIAFMVFGEAISKRLWIAIAMVTLASIILSVEDIASFQFSYGSVFVLAACVCWGFENNCTRKLSQNDPVEIVVIKGFGAGLGSLVIALCLGERISDTSYIALALLLGFVAYGLSIFFYIHAQRELGAAKTSAYYAITPFIGVALSLVIFGQVPTLSFTIALLIMLVGTYFASTNGKSKAIEDTDHLLHS
ncbi:MAG: DMT family transporter [Eubacteriales bacterium]|nr:DMT family transporter [Eubacteriales bacterium]